MYYICSCRTIVNMDSFLVDGRNFQVVLCPLKKTGNEQCLRPAFCVCVLRSASC